MAPVKQVVVLRFKDPSKKEEAIEKSEAYWKWAFENEALKEHIHHQGVKVSADGNEHTCTFVFTDGGAMDKMTPLVMSYPKMDDIMWRTIRRTKASGPEVTPTRRLGREQEREVTNANL